MITLLAVIKERRSPCHFGRGMWPAIAALEGDAGARSLFHMPAFRGRIIEAESLKFMDIDTVERYKEAVNIFKYSYM